MFRSEKSREDRISVDFHPSKVRPQKSAMVVNHNPSFELNVPEGWFKIEIKQIFYYFLIIQRTQRTHMLSSAHTYPKS